MTQYDVRLRGESALSLVPDEHDGWRVMPAVGRAMAPFDMRVQINALPEGSSFEAATLGALATYRASLSDVFVVGRAFTDHGPFGARHQAYVLSFASGIYGYTLDLSLAELAQSGEVAVISAVCLDEDYPIYLPLIDHVTRSLEITTAGTD